MAPRFEVLPEPIEDRLQKGLTSQVVATLSTLNTLSNTITNSTNVLFNTTSNAFADEEFVNRISETGIRLLSPQSLPGFLFALAIALRVARYVLISRMAQHAVSKQYSPKDEKAD
jgi:hypothetical protein